MKFFTWFGFDRTKFMKMTYHRLNWVFVEILKFLLSLPLISLYKSFECQIFLHLLFA